DDVVAGRRNQFCIPQARERLRYRGGRVGDFRFTASFGAVAAPERDLGVFAPGCPVDQSAGQRVPGLIIEQTKLQAAGTGIENENAHQKPAKAGTPYYAVTERPR